MPRRLDLPLAAIIFDMDGTLTLPGQLDFGAMRDAIGLPAGSSIFGGIGQMPPEKQAAAWATISDMEMQVYSNIQLQPGIGSLFDLLRTRALPVGVATRNNERAVAALLTAASLPADTFHPVLTRDSSFPDKPDPAIALAACTAWGIPPEATLFVGDSMDDIRCGSSAGCLTCLIRPGGAKQVTAEEAALITFTIESLHELTALIDDAVRS